MQNVYTLCTVSKCVQGAYSVYRLYVSTRIRRIYVHAYTCAHKGDQERPSGHSEVIENLLVEGVNVRTSWVGNVCNLVPNKPLANGKCLHAVPKHGEHGKTMFATYRVKAKGLPSGMAQSAASGWAHCPRV